MRVLVTGGAGFLGRHVVERLIEEGHEQPTIFDSVALDAPRRAGDRRFLLDVTCLVLGVAYDYDAVIHLAGLLGTSKLFDDTRKAIDVNVNGTLSVLEMCRDSGMRYVGITPPDAWNNVYTATKTAARMLAMAWHDAYGVPVSHVRCFNAFGKGQKVGLIPTWSTLAWQGEDIPMFGDGRQTVDLISARDVARMLVDALAFGDNDIFDAGCGMATEVRHVGQAILDHCRKRGELVEVPMRAGETEHTRIRAKGEGWEQLDWRPEFDIDELLDVVDSYKP